MMATEAAPAPRTVRAIAMEISRLWPNPYFGAVPYLQAMRSMDKVSDAFGYDSGRSIVLYFLSNAKTWRGPDAKRLKAELKALLAAK